MQAHRAAAQTGATHGRERRPETPRENISVFSMGRLNQRAYAAAGVSEISGQPTATSQNIL